MLEKSIIIENETGIHARPAAVIVKEASKYKSAVTIKKGDKSYNAKSIMSLMTMAAQKGEEITVLVDGEDETVALEGIINIIQNGLE